MTTIRLTTKSRGAYNAYIADNHTMTTDISGDERFDLTSISTTNRAVDAPRHWMLPAVRAKLIRAGVDADTAIILFGGTKNLVIHAPDDIAAILPHINAAFADRRAREAAAEERRKYRREIYLSSRGWGDYSPVKWVGDIRRPVAEIVLECIDMLGRADDVDTPMTEGEVAAKVVAAKAAEDAADKARKDEAIMIAAATAEAKATGKPVVLSSWITNDCHAHLTECSFDRAEWCAMPDGSVQVRYTHCW